MICLQPLLDELKMTHDQFVDYCILLGTDFGGKLKGIGTVKAKAIIQKYGKIETFLASSEGKKYRPKAGEEFNYDVPRIMFLDDAFPLVAHGIPAPTTEDSPLFQLYHTIMHELQNNPFPVDRFAMSALNAPEAPVQSEMESGNVSSEVSEQGDDDATRKVRRRVVHV